MTAHTTRQHIARATVEAVCFQVVEVFDAMVADAGQQPKQFLVDGGMTKSPLLLQLQANLLGCEVMKPCIEEVSALGAAVAAGVTAGVWKAGQHMEGITIYKPEIDAK